MPSPKTLPRVPQDSAAHPPPGLAREVLGGPSVGTQPSGPRIGDKCGGGLGGGCVNT